LGLAAAKNEWILMATASDLIHPRLARKLLDAINSEEFDYDVISMPYSIYVFGIKDRRSPWFKTHEDKLARKSVVSVSDRVHYERGSNSSRVYRMPDSDDEILYHLTHRNIDVFLEHHNRYCKLETDQYSDPSSIKEAFRDILRACKLVFLEKRSYKLGTDGLALGVAYISYFMIKYLFIWQKFRGRGEKTYSEIRDRLAKQQG
jgi:(heptosyl)LPS beta-1,4-glucosyltransferase